MKSILIQVMTMTAVMALCAAAAADTRVQEVWICSVNDGKSLDDVRAANAKWVKFHNANVKGADITSRVLTPIVGNFTPGRFIFVDSYPSLQSWTAARDLLAVNKEAQAIEAELTSVSSCSENHLYQAESS